MLDLIHSPLFEYSGNGTIMFDNDSPLQAVFRIKLLSNGIIEGEITFPYFHPNISKFVKDMTQFSLKGEDNKIGHHILADDCIFESLSQKFSYQDIRVKGIFSSKKVTIHVPGLSDQKLDGEILLDFGITNVHRIPAINVVSRVGSLCLANYEGIEERQKYMTVFKTPLITSSIRIVTRAEKDQRLGNIIGNAREVVEDFLKVTSLSQGVWHDWAFLSVYLSHMNPDVIQYQILHSPILKAPSFRLLTPFGYSQQFVDSIFSGYSRKLATDYGFDLALEWYIESNADAAVETNFLNATTCLELLMDKLLSEKKLDQLLSDEDFKVYYARICESSQEILESLNKEEQVINAVKSSLRQVQRMSFVSKIRSLIDYWGVTIEDTRIKVMT